MSKVAVYDNPATWCREAWKDGKMMEHVTAELLMTKGFRGGDWFPFYFNIGPWKEGQIVGDPEAIKQS